MVKNPNRQEAKQLAMYKLFTIWNPKIKILQGSLFGHIGQGSPFWGGEEVSICDKGHHYSKTSIDLCSLFHIRSLDL